MNCVPSLNPVRTSASGESLPMLPEHLPLGLNPPSEKKMLKVNKLEHVLIGKVIQLFRNML
jgi:hypothetical protein